jgi:hypothetical protein
MTTRTFILITLLFFSAVTAPLAAGGRKSVRLIPEGGRPVNLRIDGGEKEYYLLSKGAPLNLQVEGPGKLTVYSRIRFPASGGTSEKYAVRVKDGKNTLKLHSTQTEKSEATFAPSGEAAGKSRKFTMKVPEGSFTYVFSLEETAQDAALRFTFEASKDTRKRTAIEPLTYDRIVTATIKEKLLAYYVSSAQRPTTLRVVGPTKVRVTVRLNYDDKMKGEQKFAVVVSEKGTRVVTRALQTTKSIDVTYREWKEVVPGKSQSFSFDVPDGEHVYSFVPDQTLAGSVSLRFSIPQGDVANEE